MRRSQAKRSVANVDNQSENPDGSVDQNQTSEDQGEENEYYEQRIHELNQKIEALEEQNRSNLQAQSKKYEEKLLEQDLKNKTNMRSVRVVLNN